MTTPVAASPVPTIDRAALEQRVADLSLYSESGDAVADGEIWYVPETAAAFGEDGFTFGDILDVINPLHHLPVVGTLYRAVTEDAIAPAPRILGGTLFGGIAGFITGLVNAVVEDETGSDLGEKALALLGIGGNPTNIAANTPAAGPAGDATAAAGPAPAVARDEPSTAPSMAAALPVAAILSSGTTQRPGMARGAGIPLDAGLAAAKQTSAAESLIRAHAAVPTRGAARLAGLPLNQKLGLQTPRPTGAAATSARPTLGQPARAAPPPPGQTLARHGNERLVAQTAPAASVPKLMREALDKYESLMRNRQPPTVTGDF